MAWDSPPNHSGFLHPWGSPPRTAHTLREAQPVSNRLLKKTTFLVSFRGLWRERPFTLQHGWQSLRRGEHSQHLHALFSECRPVYSATRWVHTEIFSCHWSVLERQTWVKQYELQILSQPAHTQGSTAPATNTGGGGGVSGPCLHVVKCPPALGTGSLTKYNTSATNGQQYWLAYCTLAEQASSLFSYNVWLEAVLQQGSHLPLASGTAPPFSVLPDYK